MAKKKKARQVLANSLALNIELNQGQKEALKELIKEKLKNVFPKSQVPTQNVLKELSEAEKSDLFALSREERTKQIKALKAKKRSELNVETLPKEYQNGLLMGLKSTLKSLEKNQVKALVFDSNVNFEALKVLFDKGTVPLVPVPDLSKLSREIVGFSALCIGFPKEIPNEKVAQHFAPILDAIEKLPNVKIVQKPAEKTLPDVIPTQKTDKIALPKKNLALKSPRIEILTRSSTKERIFHPVSNQVKIVKDDFRDDFISFAPLSKKRKVAQDSGYKKTRVEIQK